MGKNSKTYRARRSARASKNKTKNKIYSSLLACALLAMGALSGVARCDSSSDAAVVSTGGDFEYVVIPDETPSIIKEYEGFTVNFNPSHHIPNYVVWELTGEETNGTVPRSSKFMTDNDVYGCATTDDYRNSGYDRGHMAPAADMKWSRQAMTDSHYMTNICPQSHALNGGRWATLESKCREWAKRDSALVIVAGPVLTDELSRTIGKTGVSVPERFFKVILAPYANPPRAIGFIMPNEPPYDGIESMATSVDNIEAITGFDFFSALPDEVENHIESIANYRDWNRRNR